VRRGQQQNEPRPIAFYVRAKTGSGPRDWSNIGVAFARKNDAPGFTIKINCLPLPSSGWTGAIVLVPPFADDDEPIDE
jgi:hypothetical protein